MQAFPAPAAAVLILLAALLLPWRTHSTLSPPCRPVHLPTSDPTANPHDWAKGLHPVPPHHSSSHAMQLEPACYQLPAPDLWPSPSQTHLPINLTITGTAPAMATAPAAAPGKQQLGSSTGQLSLWDHGFEAGRLHVPSGSTVSLHGMVLLRALLLSPRPHLPQAGDGPSAAAEPATESQQQQQQQQQGEHGPWPEAWSPLPALFAPAPGGKVELKHCIVVTLCETLTLYQRLVASNSSSSSSSVVLGPGHLLVHRHQGSQLSLTHTLFTCAEHLPSLPRSLLPLALPPAAALAHLLSAYPPFTAAHLHAHSDRELLTALRTTAALHLPAQLHLRGALAPTSPPGPTDGFHIPTGPLVLSGDPSPTGGSPPTTLDLCALSSLLLGEGEVAELRNLVLLNPCCSSEPVNAQLTPSFASSLQLCQFVQPRRATHLVLTAVALELPSTDFTPLHALALGRVMHHQAGGTGLPWQLGEEAAASSCSPCSPCSSSEPGDSSGVQQGQGAVLCGGCGGGRYVARGIEELEVQQLSGSYVHLSRFKGWGWMGEDVLLLLAPSPGAQGAATAGEASPSSPSSLSCPSSAEHLLVQGEGGELQLPPVLDVSHPHAAWLLPCIQRALDRPTQDDGQKASDCSSGASGSSSSSSDGSGGGSSSSDSSSGSSSSSSSSSSGNDGSSGSSSGESWMPAIVGAAAVAAAAVFSGYRGSHPARRPRGAHRPRDPKDPSARRSATTRKPRSHREAAGSCQKLRSRDAASARMKLLAAAAAGASSEGLLDGHFQSSISLSSRSRSSLLMGRSSKGRSARPPRASDSAVLQGAADAPSDSLDDSAEQCYLRGVRGGRARAAGAGASRGRGRVYELTQEPEEGRQREGGGGSTACDSCSDSSGGGGRCWKCVQGDAAPRELLARTSSGHIREAAAAAAAAAAAEAPSEHAGMPACFLLPRGVTPPPAAAAAPPPAAAAAAGAECWQPRREVDELTARLSSGDEAGDKLLLMQVIGSGACGVVFKGRWRNLDVAVKCVLFSERGTARHTPHFTLDRSAASSPPARRSRGAAVSSSSAQQRAVMEAAVSMYVNHPNAVSTYHYDVQPLPNDCGPAGAIQVHCSLPALHWQLFLVQELCESSLVQALEQGLLHCNGVARMDLLLSLLLDVAHGLEYLHAKNIIHGDLKPDNVLLKAAPTHPMGVRAKLTDFGLSVKMDPGRTHVSNAFSGTPFYICPRTLTSGNVTKASDVYSFGVLAWEAFLQQHPFLRGSGAEAEDEGTGSSGSSSGWGVNPAFCRFTRGQPATLVALVRSCLHAEPKQRPTATSVLHSLQVMQQALLAGSLELVEAGGSIGLMGAAPACSNPWGFPVQQAAAGAAAGGGAADGPVQDSGPSPTAVDQRTAGWAADQGARCE